MRASGHRVVLSALVALTLALAQTPAVGGQPVRGPGLEQVIIGWGEPAAAARAEAVLQGHGIGITERVYGGRTALVDVPDGMSAEAYAATLEELPGIAYAEPNYPVSIAWTPDDPYFNTVTPEEPDQWGPRLVGAVDAWDVARGGGVTIAVVDTGVDLTHPELASKLDTANDRDLVNDDSNANDDNGHGTHCAGIAAAVTDNGLGIAGMAPAATILPIKTLDASGNGTTADLAAGIDWAVAHGADVVNLSVGGAYGTTTLHEAVKRAVYAGVVVVAAAGNESAPVFYPAAYPECIAVAATDQSGARTSYSNWGREIDLSAPGGTSGDAIWSTVPGGYGYRHGTSMATPHVTGAVAVLFSAGMRPDERIAHATLEASALDVDDEAWDQLSGYGLLQLDRALTYLKEGDTAPPTTVDDTVPSYPDEAEIHLTATDGQWNVATTYSRLDDGPLARGTRVATNVWGSHTLAYWSVDFAGNTEEPREITFEVDDTVPPVTKSDAVGTYHGSARIKLSASDACSGIATTTWSLDGGPETDGALVSITDAGHHTLEFWSEDRAGNKEDTQAASFVLYGAADVQRIAGADRYATAIAASRSTFGTGSVANVVLATGEDFADAVSASPLAGVFGSPVLLTRRSGLPDGVLAEIGRLGASRVLIVGGSTAVSANVERALAASGLRVERVFGADRYETAAAVAARVRQEIGAAAEAAFLVRGDNFADALAVAPAAYRQHYPVLLTRPGALPGSADAALQASGADNVYIAGGSTSVSAGVQHQVEAMAGVSTTRIAGADRYETAALVAEAAHAHGWATGSFAVVATGADFPDAVGGGPVAGAMGGVLLLTRPAQLPESTRAFIQKHGKAGAPLRVFGGTPTVSEEVPTALRSIPLL